MLETLFTNGGFVYGTITAVAGISGILTGWLGFRQRVQRIDDNIQELRCDLKTKYVTITTCLACKEDSRHQFDNLASKVDRLLTTQDRIYEVLLEREIQK